MFITMELKFQNYIIFGSFYSIILLILELFFFVFVMMVF